jgi:cytochrome bd ubiquinol oxidase subunit II
MSFELLSNIWFYLMALVWSVYIVQESFVIGSGILAFKFKDDKAYRNLNHLVGTHWDGIQVWLILAVAGLFASFPRAFSLLLSNLYIPFFLLLYAIIFRGISIELIYKSENKTFQKIAKITWSISSFALFFIIGLYITNTFIGLPLENGTMNLEFFSFLALFNKFGMYGGLFFVSHSLVAGTCFLYMNTKNDFITPIQNIAKWFSVVSSFLLIFLFMGFNNKIDLFNDGLYEKYSILWALPFLSMVFMMLSSLLIWFKKYTLTFIFSSLSISLFIFTGYVSAFPYAVVATIPENGLLIYDAAAGVSSLTIMFYSTLIFLPIVIGYQLYKYIRFWGDGI